MYASSSWLEIIAAGRMPGLWDQTPPGLILPKTEPSLGSVEDMARQQVVGSLVPRPTCGTRNAEVGLVTLGKIPVCAEVSSLDFG